MKLTKPSLQDLKKVSVMIICSDAESNKGSGTVVCVDDTLYVLTAAHVISKSKNNCHEEKNIKVSAYKDDSIFTFGVHKVEYYNYEQDCAVLQVSNDNSFPEEPLKQVRILNQEPNGIGILCGFGKDIQNVKVYPFKQISDTIWSFNGFDISQQPITAKENWSGFSGGGIFYKGDEGLFLSFYMKSLSQIEGNNNEFICHPASRFAAFAQLKKLVINDQIEYVPNEGLMGLKKNDVYFQPLGKSMFSQNHEGVFIKNDKLESIIKTLKSDEMRSIMLTALSGLGKSRLLYEAFRETIQLPHRYYCKFHDGFQELLRELQEHLLNGVGSEGIIIIDDCPKELFKDVIEYRNNYNQDFRVIATNNDFFNIDDSPSYELIRLEPAEIRERVNQFIEDTLHPEDFNRASVEEIKRLSDGFPQMAIALVDEFKKENKVTVDVVKDLIPKLLKFDEDNQDNQKKVMQTLSLCLPLPYTGHQSEAFRFILSEKLFTPLNGMEWPEIRSLAEKLITKYKPTLIDIQSDWLYVRPFPLAVWLTSEWFKNVCNSNEHFKELIEKIKTQPEYIQNAISEGFCKHIEQMHGNKSAFSLVGELVNTNGQNPFFDEEVLSSGLGSKFFLSMTSVNPEATANCLASVFLSKELNWLRNNLKGDARRNIVWALEKLCFAKESYQNASKVMARLAVAENEDIGNNATGQIKQLFHLYLAGTEVDLNERTSTLAYLFSMGDDYSSLAVGCCHHAFMSMGFNRVCGAEKFGFTNKKEYQPQSYQEIYEYWNCCLNLLLKAINNNVSIIGLAADLVVDNTHQWVRSNRWNLLSPLLDSITKYYGSEWEEEYDALVRVRNITKEELPPESLEKLEQWAIKIKPKTFITDLKDARQKLWGSYRLDDSNMLQYSRELFEPLAIRFINEAVYMNEHEVDLILSDKDYIDNVFSKKVVALMPEDGLAEFFVLLHNLVLQKDDGFTSPFLINFCVAAVDTTAFADFMEKLRCGGRMMLYYNLMAYTEQNDLRHFKHLCSMYDKGELPDSFLMYYLQGVRAIDKNTYNKLLEEVHRAFPNRNNDLVHFVISHRFFLTKEELCNEIVRWAVLNYEIGENFIGYDYFRLLIDILEQSHDAEFAKSLNRKMIEVYNKRLAFHSSEGVFPTLLRNYTDDIWEDFMKAFLSPDYFLFYYQVKDELGSGYGFGRGPLFDVNETKLHQLCFTHPDVAPSRLAAMIPCFDNDSDNCFSKWFIWLLDNFGDKKEVLDALHANLGTFFWTGSTIYYYNRNISSFEKLLNHQRSEVRNWAERCLKDEKKMLDATISEEDFRRIRYDLE